MAPPPLPLGSTICSVQLGPGGFSDAAMLPVGGSAPARARRPRPPSRAPPPGPAALMAVPLPVAVLAVPVQRRGRGQDCISCRIAKEDRARQGTKARVCVRSKNSPACQTGARVGLGRGHNLRSSQPKVCQLQNFR